MKKNSWLKREIEIREQETPGTTEHLKEITLVVEKKGTADPDPGSTNTLS